jgi:ADP-ribosylglycohydrolase
MRRIAPGLVFQSKTLPEVIRKKIFTSVSWKKHPQRWATAIAMHGATEKANSGNTEVNGSASRIPETDELMRSWPLQAVFDAGDRMKNRLNQRRTHRLSILQLIESLCVGSH